jgi:hypothetical protein
MKDPQLNSNKKHDTFTSQTRPYSLLLQIWAMEPDNVFYNTRSDMNYAVNINTGPFTIDSSTQNYISWNGNT